MIWTVPRLVKKLSFRWTKNVKLCKNRQPKSVNQNTPIRGNTMYSEGCMEKETEEFASNLNVKVRAKSNRREVSPLPATLEEIGDLLDNKLSGTSPIFRKLRLTILADIKAIISQEICSMSSKTS
ncbi:unnamed protein product [Parnassius apollo]|uniref:(apollo) hypothetical protein n=1 Tax=Parnassius apollo TaxID=110799 RepID=A0A8S3XRE4_PARAO|nr:unnamed protein product [Parnassius apollo]